MNNLAKIFEGNWDEIKGKAKKYWGKLTDDDWQRIDGSYDQFIGKIKKIYGYELDKIEDEIRDFLVEIDLYDANKEIAGIKRMLRDAMEQCIQGIKNKSYDAEKTVVNYVKQKPLEAVGLLAIAGVTINCLMKIRK